MQLLRCVVDGALRDGKRNPRAFMDNGPEGYQAAMICRNKTGGLYLVANSPRGTYAFFADSSE
jgi:hypothetical protein